MIVSINFNLLSIFNATQQELTKELYEIEKTNINDLGSQVLLNYEIFREYSLIQNLNVTHGIITEANNPKVFIPYPLDHTSV